MVGILSDSHDNLDGIKSAVRVFLDAGCTLVLHAGDFVAPFAARELQALGGRIKAVFGNYLTISSPYGTGLPPCGIFGGYGEITASMSGAVTNGDYQYA